MSPEPLPAVSPASPIRDAIQAIESGLKGIAIVVSEDGKLVGTITDGDVRRAMLASVNLDAPLQVLLDRKLGMSTERPITATVGTSDAQLLHLMQKHEIRQLPILDHGGRVVEIVHLDDLAPNDRVPVQAVIMAGGFGKRLRPLTDDTPKPMLPVGDRPLIEHVVGQLRAAGIRNVNISTYYLREKIVDHFGDGRKFGVNVQYLQEHRPLGTAGSLGLLHSSNEPLLVTNGDILTSVNYRSMWNFHCKHQSTLTVATRKYRIQVPYGVVTHVDASITGLTEKPAFDFFVNAGIYLLDPYAVQLIPRDMDGDEQFHMTDLITRLIEQGRSVVNFPLHEYWLDIGELGDYQRAQNDVDSGQFVLKAA